MFARASLLLVSRCAAAAFAVALSLAPFAARANEPTNATAAAPTIYKWVDENGISHYTTDRSRIPNEIRDRVESRPAVATTNPTAPSGPTREDLMRDAVPKKATAGTSTAPLAAPSAAAIAATGVAAPNPSAAPTAAAAPTATTAPAAPEAAVIPVPTAPAETTEVVHTEVEAVAVEQPAAAEPVVIETPAPTPTEVAAPAPLTQDVEDEASAVSSPPPAPAAPVDPAEQAQLAALDQKIEAVQGEIAQREETLAALISASDEQRTTPLVDDPQFREISQRLPKLQADLQTLRERRNKIQPTASTP